MQEVPYSFKITKLDNGLYQIVITAIGFVNSRDAEDFAEDITGEKPIQPQKPTLH